MDIKTTKNYKKFRILTGNRPLSGYNLKLIAKSIARKNMLDINPIIVNQEFEIIDGQHRFQIAQENNYPISYVVLENGDLSDVQSLNNVSKKWNLEDYIRSYTLLGNQNYVRLQKFINDTQKSVSSCAILLKGTAGGHATRHVKNGTFTVTPEQIENGYRVFNLYNQVLEHFEGQLFRDEYILKAIFRVDEEGLLEEIIKRMRDKNITITHRATQLEYLRDFESILNYKKRAGSAKVIRLF